MSSVRVVCQKSDRGAEVAIVMLQDMSNIDQETYETVLGRLGSETNPPEGLLIQALLDGEGGRRLISMWESQEALDRFEQERLLPVINDVLGEEAVAGGPPPREFYEVQHLLRP